MSSNSNSTAINSTNSVPYLTSDRTELAPLCSSHQDTKGLRVIISCLTVLTVLVSMGLASQLHNGDFQVIHHGTVVSDDAECSAAGVETMRKGGNAVDAVITTLFCLSVVLPHLVGVGGGGYMIIHNQRQRQVVGCLDFRPVKGVIHSSIGVPGFVAGLNQAHKQHGKMPWATLLNAAIELAGSGFKPSANLLSAIPFAQNRSELLELLTSGHNLPLFDTLTAIAQNGSHEFYNGSLSGQMVGPEFVSAEDLAQYRVVSGQCQQQMMGHYQMSTAGPGSGGPLLLHLLNKINQTTAVDDPVFRVALGLKETVLVSRKYSSGVNVVATDNNDIYVSVVSGLGSVLGSLDLTKGGYLMNNILSSAAVGEDGRPESLASPILVTQPGSVCGHRFIMGANDVRYAAQLWLEVLTSVNSNNTLQWASNVPRARIFAHQVQLETKHNPQLDPLQVSMLQALNFTITESPEPYPSLNVIHKLGDLVTAIADSRGGGSPASF